MFFVIWEYKVKSGEEENFEKSYGPNGAWIKFFKPCKDYLSTDLIKGIEAPRTYLTLDKWTSEKAYVDYLEKNKDKYEEIDDEFTSLTEFQTKIGSYNTLFD